MSSPHFYQADQKYIDDVAGMNPNKEDHQTIMDINPVSSYNVCFDLENQYIHFTGFCSGHYQVLMVVNS